MCVCVCVCVCVCMCVCKVPTQLCVGVETLAPKLEWQLVKKKWNKKSRKNKTDCSLVELEYNPMVYFCMQRKIFTIETKTPSVPRLRLGLERPS